MMLYIHLFRFTAMCYQLVTSRIKAILSRTHTRISLMKMMLLDIKMVEYWQICMVQFNTVIMIMHRLFPNHVTAQSHPLISVQQEEPSQGFWRAR